MFPEHLQPNAGLQLLSGFINAAADANIIAGVQVKLLNEFALQYCKGRACPGLVLMGHVPSSASCIPTLDCPLDFLLCRLI